MLDPLELVRQAKNRHYAYKPLAESAGILGESYTPSILQGRDITKNPAGAAALAAQGVRGANTPQVRPNSPLDPVQPTANGQPLPGFAGGGEVISKVSKIIQDLLKRFGAESLPSDVAETSQATTQLPSAQERLRRAASQISPDNGVDPYNTADRLAKQREAEDILGTAVSPTPSSMLLQPGFLTSPQGMAKGGTTDDSSLRWLVDKARQLGIPSMADDRARVATGIAKQFYGLDEHGNPKFGGEAWLSSQHGTPPRILDELTAIPGGLVGLFNAVNGPGPKGTTTPSPPKWSTDAQSRLDALDKKVKAVTGVGDAHTLPEHIEDAAGMLATPLPASKVAEDAPMLQRALEYLTPVRPPTAARYATDATMLGGVSSGLDKALEKLSAKYPQESEDPQFEQAAINATNSHYAGGGEVVDQARRALLKLLGASAAAAPIAAIKTVKEAAPKVEQTAAPAAAQAVAPAVTKTPSAVPTLLRLEDELDFHPSPENHMLKPLLQKVPGSEKAQSLLDHWRATGDPGPFMDELDNLNTIHIGVP